MLCDGFLCVPVSEWTVTVVRVLCEGFLCFPVSQLDCDSCQGVV